MAAALVFFLRGAVMALGACVTLRLTASPSIYLQRPADPAAIDLSRSQFEVQGNGVADDAPALQAAIDRVHAQPGHRGILFVGPGKYRLGKTINVWRGVRLIGYGPERPTFVLGAATAGFQGEPKPLFFFASDPPNGERPVREGGASGFFAAIVNADIEIGDGNPGAVGVTFHVAQHSFLAHMDFRIGSGRAGMNAVGNLIHHCTFTGGEYGIIANRTAPAWPFVVADCTFAGQRNTAIHTEEAGLTLVRTTIRDVPRAVEVTPNEPEQLWISDSLFERISGPAITVSETQSARSQTNLHNIICRQTPVLLILRESGKTLRGEGAFYRVADVTHGWQSAGPGAESGIETRSQLEPLVTDVQVPASDFAVLPPVSEWVDVRTLGVKGDGTTDDTAALQQAIQQHRVLYLPSGKYLIRDTLRLQPDSIVIGLHSSTTQLVADPEARAFQGEGPTMPMVESASGGTAVFTGVGIDMQTAPRVAGIKWRSGTHSVVEDVCFASSHSARGERPDADVRTAWDTQNHSLWICDGGGGTFDNIWTANTTARSGLLISNTETPGRVYVLSSEHHVYHEVRLDRVAHWSFYGLQTEAEGEEGPALLPIDLRQSHDLLFATTFVYRVSRTRTPFPTAIRTTGSNQVSFRGLHIFSPTKYGYDNAVIDADTRRSEKGREWAQLTINHQAAPERLPPAGVRIRELATDFESIDGLIATAAGGVCFSDGRQGRVYEWTPEHGAQLRYESPVRPMMLTADPNTGALLLIARSGATYRLEEKPGSEGELVPLERIKRDALPASTAWLRPTNIYGTMGWIETATQRCEFAWRSGSAAIPVDRTVYAGFRPPSWANNPFWRAYNLHVATPGRDFFVADEYRQKTYRVAVAPDGALQDPKLFATVGEADIVQDPAGNVYIAAGDIFIFSHDGQLRGRIPLPERPLGLAFARHDDRTLYVAARRSLYVVELPR